MNHTTNYIKKAVLILLFLSTTYLMSFHGYSNPIIFIFSYTISFIIMISLWRSNSLSFSFSHLFLIALLARVLMLHYPAGDDINRYIWEGEIQNAGYNPFELAPNSNELKHLRNSNWEGINHKNLPTIYWPFAQLLFKFITQISPTSLLIKIFIIIFDLGTLFILFQLSKLLKLNPNNLILYALNPFVLHWFAGEGHLESVVVFWIMLSLLLYKMKKFKFMFITFSLAIMTKITPIFLFPFLLTRENFKWCFLFLIPTLLFLPYINSSVNPFEIPTIFTSEFIYNGLINSVLNLFWSKGTTLYISFIIAIISFLFIYLTTTDTIRAIYLSLALFILCSPTFHPWYLLLITPFMVIYSSPHWILLHLTISAKAFFWINSIENEFWHNDPFLLFIEYLPFVGLFVYTLLFNRVKFPYKYKKVNTISVIIPVLNETKNIQAALASIINQKYLFEIILSDGGSSDNTIEIAKQIYPIRTINTERGRGIQISEALEIATGDVVCILHADSTLNSNAFKNMIEKLNSNRDSSGGAFGAVYANYKFPLLIPRLLNIFRAGILGISFGDQAQFFRREIISSNFPKFKLMEDIELSLRMKQYGKVLYIPKGVVSSSRMWKKSGYIKNFVKVIYLSTLFLIKRKLGLLSDDCNEFYRVYYEK